MNTLHFNGCHVLQKHQTKGSNFWGVQMSSQIACFSLSSMGEVTGKSLCLIGICKSFKSDVFSYNFFTRCKLLFGGDCCPCWGFILDLKYCSIQFGRQWIIYALILEKQIAYGLDIALMEVLWIMFLSSSMNTRVF